MASFDSNGRRRDGESYRPWNVVGLRDLERQVKYEIVVNGEKICRYIADFRYKMVDDDGTAKEVVEDAKGFETADFKLKKLMKAVYKIDLYLSKKAVDKR